MDNSPFQRLPAELRGLIWKFAVTEEHDIIINGRDLSDQDNWLQPSISRVCKQIRLDCLGMFYASNVFKIGTFIGEFWNDLADVPTGIDENGAERYVRGVEEFCQAVTQWLIGTTAEHHALLHLLSMEVYVDSSFDSLQEFIDSEEYWRDLARLLRRYGYVDRRLKIVVEVRNYTDHNEAIFRDVFNDASSASLSLF